MSLVIAIALAAGAAPSLAEARRSLIGEWTGKIEYRDYQSNRWFGLPVTVAVRDGGDGVTLIRTADYDDGPATGVVRITTVSMLDAAGAREMSATFRKGHKVELQDAALAIAPASSGSDSWVLVETIAGSDDDRPATIRLTTTRTGKSLVTIKEIDFIDDGKTEWMVRNRTSLTAK